MVSEIAELEQALIADFNKKKKPGEFLLRSDAIDYETRAKRPTDKELILAFHLNTFEKILVVDHDGGAIICRENNGNYECYFALRTGGGDWLEKGTFWGMQSAWYIIVGLRRNRDVKKTIKIDDAKTLWNF